MEGRDTTGAGLPVHRDQESNPSTDDARTASAYLTAVYRQPVVGEEQAETANLGPETSKHGYVEGLCCC